LLVGKIDMINYRKTLDTSHKYDIKVIMFEDYRVKAKHHLLAAPSGRCDVLR